MPCEKSVRPSYRRNSRCTHGWRHVQHMMQVIVPLRRVMRRSATLTDEPHASFSSFSSNRWIGRGQGVRALDEFVKEMLRASSMMACARQAQAVEIEFLEPVERVVNHELPHRLAAAAIIIDCGAPRRVAQFCEKCGAYSADSFHPGRMTVDYIEQHSDTAGMRGLDQRLKILRASIGRVGRVEQYAVITPIAPAGSPTQA